MSAEAEKIKTPEEWIAENANLRLYKNGIEYIEFTYATKLIESYHQFMKSQELEQLTDERIEEIVEKKYIEPTESPFDPWNKLWLREGAKALRDHLKQSKTQ